MLEGSMEGVDLSVVLCMGKFSVRDLISIKDYSLFSVDVKKF